MKKMMMLFGAAWLGIVGASSALADGWTYSCIRYGRWAYGPSNAISYNGISTSQPNWGSGSAYPSGSLHTSGDYALVQQGTSVAGTVQLGIAIYYTYRTIPSYSKLSRTAKFQTWLASNRHHHGGGIYLFDSESTAKATTVDCTYLQERSGDAGEKYKICKSASTNSSGTHDTGSSGTKTMTYDNSTGSSDQNIYKYIVFEHSSATAITSVNGTEWMSFKETSSSDTWTYYKYLTFDANGGTGSMSQQTISNSGTIKANGFTRTGLTFLGWNTKADGTGTAYAAGASITATSSSKGPVTLYAQWGVCKNKATGTLYASVNAAAAAVTTGATIQLITNSTENATIPSGKNLTLDLAGKKLSGAASGSIITVNASASLTLEDTGLTGVITGGNATNGGAVNVVAGGTFTMNGGTITNCTASSNGGAVYNAGTFTMNDGTISGCSAYYGCVYSAGTLTVNSGKFLDNHAAWGGAIYGDTSFDVYGGYFRGNSATLGGQVLIYANWEQKCYVYGGVFDGYDPQTYGTDDARAIKLMNSKTKVGSNYVIGSNVLVSCGTLVNGTYTFCPTNEIYSAAGVTVDVAKCTMTLDTTKTPTNYVLTAAQPIEVSSWSEVKSALEAGKNVKLAQDIAQTTSDSPWISKTAGEVTLDLNGHVITQYGESNGSKYLVYDNSGKIQLTIKDSVGNGAIVGNPDYPTMGGSGGGGFYLGMTSGSSLTLESGVLRSFRLTNDNKTKSGGCIYVNANATFTMNGGAISNCTSASTGGAVYSAGTMTMTGGTISGCTSTSNGGAIYSSNGALTLKNGTISGCSSSNGGGGAVLISGASSAVAIENMKFLNNQAKNGWGGVINFGNAGGSYVMRNCTVTGNSASKSGGAVSIGTSVQLDIYDCTITGNESTAGAAVCLNEGTGNRLRIYGVVLANNTKGTLISDFEIQRSGAATVYGGVYGADPSGVTNLTIADGYASTLIGSKYVVGKSVAQVDSELTGGTYTFCPTNAEYAAAGLGVLENVNITTAPTATPPTWTLDSNYTITLDRQGGTGGSSSVTAQYGAAMPAITPPTRGGYGFGGYFSEANGAGVQYYTAVGASARTSDLNTNATLYAKWTVEPDPLGAAVGDGSIKFTTTKPYVWTVDTTKGRTGGACAKSGGYHVNYSSSELKTTVESVKKVSFHWSVSSERSYDKVTFYIGGVQKAQISGSYGWTAQSFTLDPTKSYELKWIYTKDCSCHSGSDCAWLDDLVLERTFTGSGTAESPWILPDGGDEADVLRAGATYKAGDPARYFKDADEANGSGLTPVTEIPLDDIMLAKGYVARSGTSYYRTFDEAIAGCGGNPIKILDLTAKLPKFYKNEEGYLVPWSDEDWEGVVTDPMDLETKAPADFNAGATTGVRVKVYGDDYLLGNNFIELGLRPGGAFGTKNTIPASTGFHANISGYNTTTYLGLRATMTGWGEGSDPQGLLTRDFFTPGTIDEGWMVTVGTAVKGAGRNGTRGDSNVTKVYTKIGADDIAGVKVEQRFTVTGNIRVDQTVAFGPDDKQYWTYVTLSNTGSSDLANVNYYRAFDPDQPGNCSYSTDNYYHKDDDGGIWSIAFSYSTGVSTYAAFDDIVAKGQYPFFFYVEASDAYTLTPVTQSVGWSNYASSFSNPANNYHRYYDTGMGIKVTFAKIAKGKSVSFRYLSSLDPNTDRAVAAAKPIKMNGRYYTLPEAVLWVKSHGSDGQTLTVLDTAMTVEEVRLQFRAAGWDAELAGTSGTGGTNRDFLLREIHTYWVKMNVGRGRLPSDRPTNPIEFTAGTGDVIELPTPTRANYEFAGWYLDSACTGTRVTSVDPKTEVSDVVLYAKWTAGVTVDVTLTPTLVVGGKTYTDPDRASSVTFTAKLYGNNESGRTFIGTETAAIVPSEATGYVVTLPITVSCNTGDYDSFTVETVSSRANYTSLSSDIESGHATAEFQFCPEEFQFKYSVQVADSPLKAKVIGLDAIVVSPLNGTIWKVIQQLDYPDARVHSEVVSGAANAMYPVWTGGFDNYPYSVDVLGVYVEGDRYIPASAFGDALDVAVLASADCHEVAGRKGAYYDGAQVGTIVAQVTVNTNSFYWAPAGTDVKLVDTYYPLAGATNAVASAAPGAYAGKKLWKVNTALTDRNLREAFAPTGYIPVREEDDSYTLTAVAAKLVRTRSDGSVHTEYFTTTAELTATATEEGDRIVVLDSSVVRYDDFKDAFKPFSVVSAGGNEYVIRSLATAAVTVTLDPRDGAELDPSAPTGVVFTVTFYGVDTNGVKDVLGTAEVKRSQDELVAPYTVAFTTNFTYGIGSYASFVAEATVNRENYMVTGGTVEEGAATLAFSYHATMKDFPYAVRMADATVGEGFRPTEIQFRIVPAGSEEEGTPVVLLLANGFGSGTNRVATGTNYEIRVTGYVLRTGVSLSAATDALHADVTVEEGVTLVSISVNAGSPDWDPNGSVLPRVDEDTDDITNAVITVETSTPETTTNRPIRVKKNWVRTHHPDFIPGTTSIEEVDKFLDTKHDNGHSGWQSYILGLDPSNKTSAVYADAPQDPKPDRVTVKAKNVNAISGYTVKYRLDTKLRGSSAYVEGEEQDSADFPVAVTAEDPTGLYKVTMLMSETGAGTSTLKAETINTVGLVKATNTNKYSVIAVPWKKLAPGEEADIAVSNVIKTANLEAGDKLHVYRSDKRSYDTWTLNENKQWDSAKNYKIGKDGKVSATESDDAVVATIARGNGVWLERLNPTNAPYFLYGQATSNAAEIVVEFGHNLLGAPGVDPFALSHIKGAAEERDQVLVPGAQPKLFTFKDGKWGTHRSIEVKTGQTIFGETTAISNVWTTAESEIPAGTGYWLINKSGNPITIE